MKKSPVQRNLFAGVDAPVFDTREFHVSKNDIEKICDFFSIGKLKSFEAEKNSAISHSNFFVFVKTVQGRFALKFFPGDAARAVSIEYTLNRFLINRNFATPEMRCGHNNKTYLPCNGRLATCFNFIDGKPAWQVIKQRGTAKKINSSILSLKQLLACAPVKIPRLKQDTLTAMAKSLAQTSRNHFPYDQKELIDQRLADVCREYQHHRKLFIRQWLHNNTTLTNFLFKGKVAYMLDLSHIREDYALSDLASLIISCHFLRIPQATTNQITRDYFQQLKIAPQYRSVLKNLISISLIKEYLKTVSREKSLPDVSSPERIKRSYLFYLQDRKRTILRVLEKQA